MWARAVSSQSASSRDKVVLGISLGQDRGPGWQLTPSVGPLTYCRLLLLYQGVPAGPGAATVLGVQILSMAPKRNHRETNDAHQNQEAEEWDPEFWVERKQSVGLCTEDEGVIMRELLLQDLISYAVSHSKRKGLLQIKSLFPIRKLLCLWHPYISCPRGDLLDAGSKCPGLGSLHRKADMLPRSPPNCVLRFLLWCLCADAALAVCDEFC